jgi:TadE-like protein
VLEFALVLPLLLLMLLGTLDYGLFWQVQITGAQAAADGARYAALFPTAWSNATAPPDNSIEGQMVLGFGDAPVPLINSDSDIQIRYYTLGGNSASECGYYSASSGSFVGLGGNTQMSCVVAGNEVWIQLSVHYAALSEPGGKALGATFGSVAIEQQSSEIIP